MKEDPVWNAEPEMIAEKWLTAGNSMIPIIMALKGEKAATADQAATVEKHGAKISNKFGSFLIHSYYIGAF